MLVFTDRVLDAIYDNIGRHPPERGGALLSFPWTNWIVAFAEDPAAEVTFASYVPSAGLTDRVRALESEAGYQFAGVIHSHPGGSDQPSRIDHNAFRRGLDINPHLAAFVAPIITQDRPPQEGALGECSLGEFARMSVYVAYRLPEAPETPAIPMKASRGWKLGHREPREPMPFPAEVARYPRSVDPSPVRIERCGVEIMPLGAHVDEVVRRLRERIGGEVTAICGRNLEIGGAWHVTEDIAFSGGALTFLFSNAYPSVPPIVLLRREAVEAGTTEQLHFEWPLFGGGESDALWRRLEPALLTRLNFYEEMQ